MTLEERVDSFITKYENRFKLILEDMRNDLEELIGVEGAVDEVSVGEARKVAILKACSVAYPDLKRPMLSGIAKKYGKAPGGVGVYFRPDVDLLRATSNFGRKITEKGLSLVRQYDEKYGNDWVSAIEKTLADTSVYDSTKIKLKLKKA